jgi:NAD(P)-dependent dehydrogenase (short-subunit alcohol dehydrogenase family)
VRADVTRPKDWDRLFATVLQARRRLDILVNNAGAGVKVAPLAEQTDASIIESIAVNLTGALFGCRRAAAVMQKQKDGVIINISSVCALYAWPGFAVYTAAKAGMNHFSHSLYNEMRPFGVRVTTLTPSWGATDFVKTAKIKGHPAGDPEIRKQCIQPIELGELVVQICTQPAHLAIPDVTLQPLVQEIVPM